MSAPTRDDWRLMMQGEYRPIGWGFAHRYRSVTPADVRLWLLDQGAEQRTDCEIHKSSVSTEAGFCDYALWIGDPHAPCRLVSVLVWRT